MIIFPIRKNIFLFRLNFSEVVGCKSCNLLSFVGFVDIENDYLIGTKTRFHWTCYMNAWIIGILVGTVTCLLLLKLRKYFLPSNWTQLPPRVLPNAESLLALPAIFVERGQLIMILYWASKLIGSKFTLTMDERM